MSDLSAPPPPPSPPPPPGAVAPHMHTRWHVSPIWFIPIVAVFIAAWLAYTTLSARGPTITITFRTGEGIDASKTRIRHNDVELGVVDKVELSPDFSHVIVTASMNRTAADHLNAGTRFWVVRPRLSLSSFSGLETLVSGAYLEMDPGEGQPAREFVGLEEPPVVRADVPGHEYILTTDRLGSIGPGSPVYYRSVPVGEVLGYEFVGNGDEIHVHAFVNSPYDRLIYPGTKFWNDSGVSVKAGAGGFKVELESITALLSGGVGFDSPDQVRVGVPAKEGALFKLFADHDTVLDAGFQQRVPFIIDFQGSVHGLEVGAPVEFRGIRVGSVTDIRLQFDSTTGQVQIPVTVDFEPQRIERAGVDPNAPSDLGKVMAAMNELVQRGMRAQLQTASLITGQLIVAFDFFPDAPPAQITFEGRIPVMPSVPSDLQSLTATADHLLAQISELLVRVQKMPIEQVIQDARSVMDAYRALAADPQLRGSIAGLDVTLKDADASLKQVNDLVNSAKEGYGNDSQIRQEIADLLKQLQDTAKSVRLLADFAEQHPEAFLRGKGADK